MKNAALIGALLALLAFLSWHDAYTEQRIAEIDAQSVRTVACDEVAVAGR